MPQSLAKVAVHIVFSTKHRKPLLRREICNELYPYMATVLRQNVDSPAIQIGGVEDHIHCLALLSRKYAIKSVIEEMKTETSKWVKKQAAQLRGFRWQNGYGAFSVSESNIDAVKRYIVDQETHHRKMTFQDEFRILCRRHGIRWDERYMWD